MSSPREGLLVILSGPSGVGKDTILARMRALDPTIRYSVSFTTRPPRPGEVDSVEYSFVDEATFREMSARGEFLEWAEVHGSLYGTAMERVAQAVMDGDVVVLKIDVQGAARVRLRLREDGVRRRLRGGGLFVFLVPPSMSELRQRLHGRETDPKEAIERRLDRATAELLEAETYDHRIVNRDVDQAAREVLELIRDQRSRTAPA